MRNYKTNLIFLINTFLWMNILSGQIDLGVFDNQANIGNCKNEGRASFQPNNQTYTISGAGTNMWANQDEFHYLWTALQGDFIVRAEVQFLGKGVDLHRKVGWIVKNDLQGNSPHVNATVHGDGLTSLQYRKEMNGPTLEVISTDSFPDVIQLERKGNTYIMSTSKFGKELTSVQLIEMQLDRDVYVGIYVCSHNPDIMETAVFRNVRIIQPADADFRPYQDCIGSHLEVMDVETGHREILYSSAHSLQAPNWSIDGEKLIYNSKGRLYEYGLKDHSIQPLNTGHATQNNNDHVLTFDGKWMGLSHHDPDEKGTSRLYYLPSEGSDTPIAVTKPKVGASYLHGWSPDNSKMVFTGNRKGRYDIYTVDVKTGAETQLTNQATLDDGPEYSPDGKFIFFNSVRTGKMKIWKMNANGDQQIQVTFDDYNDWFPHVSPDQKWIVFLSFPKEIDPTDHPFYKHCLIRIMPYQGGTPRVIGYIYGGQGTINVPSWSPDGKKIAFITNTKM